MLPASNRASGTAQGFPDTCNTPNGSGVDVPTPYTNTGDHAQSQGYSQTVFITMMNALSQSATVPTTSGDESGTTHPTIKGVMSHTVGNPIVFVNSVPGINVTSTTSHNNGNCPSGTVVSPGAATVFYTLKHPGIPGLGEGRAMSTDELEERLTCLEGPTVEAVDGSVLRIRLITERTATELARSDRDLPAGPFTLDLRGCRGGVLSGAVSLLSLLLPEGAHLFTTRDVDGDLTMVRGRGGPRIERPLVVLVDGETASAAELVASALSSHERAAVLGGPTAGKLSAQRVVASRTGEPILVTCLDVQLG